MMRLRVNRLEGRSGDEVINQIIAVNKSLNEFWSSAQGWAPIEAAELMSKSRLDWQVSLSYSLKLWLEEPSAEERDGRLILAWSNLGSMVEGSMKLFLSVYYQDYKQDELAIRNKHGIVSPDEVKLDKMRDFFNRRIWQEGEQWDKWVLHIQQRRNAIHAYKERELGTFGEFKADLKTYYMFLRYHIEKLPYPDDNYMPRF